MVTFKHGPESGGLYLEPGDNVTLFLNPAEFDETLRLAGDGAEESNYLLAKYLLNEKYNEKRKETFSSTPAKFAASMDKIKTENNQHLETYSSANQNMNSDFITNEKSSILYTWATSKINYPAYYPYYAGDEAPELELEDDYLSFMDKIDLNDETAFENNRQYAQMTNAYINSMGQKAGDGLDNLAGMFEAASSKIKSDKIKSGILSKTLTNFLNYNDATGAEKYVEMFNKMSLDEKQKKSIGDTYATAMKLLKGKPAPTFNYTNTKGKAVPLEALKGKSVYVDVWATWCGPCKREIPHLKELEAQYHENEDIVFMSVSIDKMEDKEKWLKMVEEKELSGIQLMADNDGPIPYGYVDDRDIMWSKVVWEFVDLNQKINLPYYFPIDTTNISSDRRSLFDTLVRGIKQGKIKEAYSDSFFNSKITLIAKNSNAEYATV